MRVAVLQSRTGIDPARNTAVLVRAIGEAARGGADMLFTPEMSGLLDRDRERARNHISTEAEDQLLRQVRAAAADAKIWVQLGSLALDGGRPDGRLVNRAFLIDDKGDIRARYDKIHLFDVDLPTGESWRESATYEPGDQAVAAETPWGMIGLSICYDVRFSDLYRALSDAGATILSVPAAFTVPTGQAHWHVLLRARAIEAGAHVVAAAQVGLHEDGRTTFGHSLVLDPWGEVLLDMGDDEGVGFADISPERMADVRARIPVLRHRRKIGAVTIAP